MPPNRPVTSGPRALRDAAVIVPLYRDAAGEVRIGILRRTERGIHGGQLAFPGGKRDPGDASMLDTALREAHEEIGLGRDGIEILAHLPAFETRTTGFRVHPFLARIRRPDQWVPARDEVQEVIEVPVPDLLRPDAHGEGVWQMPSWPEARRISFYHVGRHRLWGVSYRILHPILPRIAAGEWSV